MSPVRTFKRTKVVITLGPATDDPNIMDELILAGANVARVNFSHGSTDDQIRRVAQVRASASRVGRSVGILGDLSGPKIRIDRFVDGFIELVTGAQFTIDLSLAADAGTITSVGCSYKALASDVEPGAILLLNDGLIVLEVIRVEGPQVLTRVIAGGRLSNNKGLNRRGGGLSAGALTDKDRQDIPIAAKLAVDYLAVSFPRSVADIEEARALMRAAGGHARLMAKIERTEAITHLESIVTASDAVMVARGDLGIEVGDAALMGLQKQIIASARRHNKIVVTATQMMESMINNPSPTRAEVSDVANAVFDGTDAVMLSAESAVGKYPVRAVQAMSEIILGAERYQVSQAASVRRQSIAHAFHATDEAIAMAVMYTANHMDVRAIVAMTESGSTPLWMSRIRSDIPIFAFTRNEATQGRVTLFRGVYPVLFDVARSPDVLHPAIFKKLLELNVCSVGDQIIVTNGEFSGVSGGTNSMKILTVPA
jgi:pyruvate kinase